MVGRGNNVRQGDELLVWKLSGSLGDLGQVEVSEWNASVLCLAARECREVAESRLARVLASVEDVLKQRRVESLAGSVATREAGVALSTCNEEAGSVSMMRYDVSMACI